MYSKSTNEDERFMRRCLALARCGAGRTAPNPMVGAVVVHEGRIIGEGYHRAFGGPHAEVHAIAAVRDRDLLRRSTLYVTLEPCSHHGKTPPCADLICRSGIPRVVVACVDPFPKVAGRGIGLLREAGVEVVVGVLEAEARHMNRFFLTAQTEQRPYVILKWAESADGFIDARRLHADRPPVRLSDERSTRAVHSLRAEVASILVGARTARLDDPSLTVRHWSGPSPVRILLDRRGIVPPTAHLFDGRVPTLLFTSPNNLTTPPNVTRIDVDQTQPVLQQLLQALHERQIQSLLVEGGAELHSHFIREGLWDEAHVETAPILLRDGVRAADLHSEGDAVRWSDHTDNKKHLLTVFFHRRQVL